MIELSRFTLWLNTLESYLFQNSITVYFVLAFMPRCLLISFYCVLVYCMMMAFRRVLRGKLSVRAHYYSWYTLLLAFPLSRLRINDSFKLLCYDLIIGDFTPIYDLVSIRPTAPEQMELLGKQLDWLMDAARVVRMLLYIAIVVWLIGMLVKCLRQIAVNIRLERAILRQVPFDDRDELKIKAAKAFGMQAEKIRIVRADFIDSPVSYGMLRKTVLLPHDYESRYSSSELYMLLLHEMGHIKNHDTVKLQLIALAECFIGPLRRMKKRFIRDTEILCDNRVLGVCHNQQDEYSELIVRECVGGHAVKGIAFSDSYHTIKSRLEAIELYAPERHHMAALALAIIFVLVGTAIYASWHPASWLKTEYTDVTHYLQEGEFDVQIIHTDVESGEFWRENFHHLLTPTTYENGELVERNEELERSEPEMEALLGACHYDYENQELRLDKVAIFEFLLPYLDENPTIAGVGYSTRNPIVMDTTREGRGTMTIRHVSFSLSIDELMQSDEDNRYATFQLRRSVEDWVLIFIAYWL